MAFLVMLLWKLHQMVTRLEHGTWGKSKITFPDGTLIWFHNDLSLILPKVTVIFYNDNGESASFMKPIFIRLNQELGSLLTHCVHGLYTFHCRCLKLNFWCCMLWKSFQLSNTYIPNPFVNLPLLISSSLYLVLLEQTPP